MDWVWSAGWVIQPPVFSWGISSQLHSGFCLCPGRGGRVSLAVPAAQRGLWGPRMEEQGQVPPWSHPISLFVAVGVGVSAALGDKG